MGAFVLTPLKYFYPPALCKATVVPEASYPYTGAETQRFNVILAHTHPYPLTPHDAKKDIKWFNNDYAFSWHRWLPKCQGSNFFEADERKIKQLAWRPDTATKTTHL